MCMVGRYPLAGTSIDTTHMVIPDMLRMTCRVEHPGMPYPDEWRVHSLVLGKPVPCTIAPRYTSRSIVRCMLLCSVEPWMHEVEDTRPHSIPSTYLISWMRWVVDSIEVVDMDPRYGISIPSALRSWWYWG